MVACFFFFFPIVILGSQLIVMFKPNKFFLQPRRVHYFGFHLFKQFCLYISFNFLLFAVGGSLL